MIIAQPDGDAIPSCLILIMIKSMSNRRTFLKQTFAGAALLGLAPLKSLTANLPSGIEFSLAEWSLHRTIREGKLDHLDFPAKAREFGFEAVEYVNGLFGGKKMDFKEAANNTPYLNELLKRSKDAG